MSDHARLSALDDSFLAVESTTAPMHVGWAAALAPPEQGAAPSFGALRDHIESRLPRAPRFRQKLAAVPLGVTPPAWVDDQDFRIDRHVRRDAGDDLWALADTVMSEPLAPDRPLWELRIADRLADGRLGVVGKAHHCMVDGIAAVELMSLLLDLEPEPEPAEPDRWQPLPLPGALALLAEGAREQAAEIAGLARESLRLMLSPRRLRALPGRGLAWARAGRGLARPAAPSRTLNAPISHDRRLIGVRRPVASLLDAKRRFGVTLNDVVLAACAGALRHHAIGRGEAPRALKAMVPVSVRGVGAQLGNHISFVFVTLPCAEPDPVARIRDVNEQMREHKRTGMPGAGGEIISAAGLMPRALRHAAAGALASPRTFNLVVSNIPGPRRALYMLGCELQEAYPVVPLADRHALSIGFTTIGGHACFGIYADPAALPDADWLAEALEASIDEIVAAGAAEQYAAEREGRFRRLHAVH